jgi:hypothetical protein
MDRMNLIIAEGATMARNYCLRKTSVKEGGEMSWRWEDDGYRGYTKAAASHTDDTDRTDFHRYFQSVRIRVIRAIRVLSYSTNN